MKTTVIWTGACIVSLAAAVVIGREWPLWLLVPVVALTAGIVLGFLLAEAAHRRRDRLDGERAVARYVEHLPVEHRIRCMEGR